MRDVADRAMELVGGGVVGSRHGMVPLRKLGGCVVDVHYSWDCMELAAPRCDRDMIHPAGSDVSEESLVWCAAFALGVKIPLLGQSGCW